MGFKDLFGPQAGSDVQGILIPLFGAILLAFLIVRFVGTGTRPSAFYYKTLTL